MTTSPAAPSWAVALTAEVCSEAGVAPPDRLRWRRRRGEQSTGVTRHAERLIAVRAGADEIDQRLTLLHELAHWLVLGPRRKGRQRALHHGLSYYATAFGLYRRHGLTDADALRLESARYPSALRHAVELGVDGAAAALAERLAGHRARPRRRWRIAVPEHVIRLERDGRWTRCGVCGQRIVGASLARLRRSRRPGRHVLMSSAD